MKNQDIYVLFVKKYLEVLMDLSNYMQIIYFRDH